MFDFDVNLSHIILFLVTEMNNTEDKTYIKYFNDMDKLNELYNKLLKYSNKQSDDPKLKYYDDTFKNFLKFLNTGDMQYIGPYTDNMITILSKSYMELPQSFYFSNDKKDFIKSKEARKLIEDCYIRNYN